MTWKSFGTGRCLSFEVRFVDQAITWLGTASCNGSGSSYQTWYDTQYSDGYWTERPRITGTGGSNYCLTSYGEEVYTEPCQNPPNDWQRWAEIKVGSGWHLKSKATGMLLDSNAGGSVYGRPGNDGNLYQLWG
ncbi:MAG: hypothetical protein ABIQ18_02775 [Umezawaea sp.]